MEAALRTKLDYAKESPLFYKVFILVTLGMMLDASDVYIASVINTSITQDHFATIAQGAHFLSAGFLGLFIGSIIAGFMGDFWGRKSAYQINLLLFGSFTILASFMPNVQLLILCRFIAACGLGAEIVTGYAIVNEFAPAKNRGKWAGATAVIANLGAPLALLLADLLVPKFTWRSLLLVIGILALLLWFARWGFPESPRWLLTKDRYGAAKHIISKLSTNGYYTNRNNKPKLTNTIQISRGKALFIATVLTSAVLISEYTFTSFVPTLLLKKGITIVHSFLFTTFMMIGAPVGALIGTILVSTLGRKKTIIPSLFLAAIIGIMYGFQSNSLGTILFGFLLTMLFYILMASVVGVYVSELFSTSFRFRGAGIANAVAKLLTVLMPIGVTWFIARFPVYALFYIIAIIMIIAAIVGMFGPETKKQRLS